MHKNPVWFVLSKNHVPEEFILFHKIFTPESEFVLLPLLGYLTYFAKFKAVWEYFLDGFLSPADLSLPEELDK